MDTNVLRVDIETYCDLELRGPKGVGLYKYVDHPSFEVMLIGVKYPGQQPYVIDLMLGGTPEDFIQRVYADLVYDAWTKRAWNAAFEITALSKHLGLPTPPVQWRCSMVEAYAAGLPGALGQAGAVLGVDELLQKDKEGKDLIKLFCKPRKPTKKDKRTRVMPQDEPEKWQRFKEYCAQDIIAEEAIEAKINSPLSDFEQHLWVIDQEINQAGVYLDPELVAGACRISADYKAALKAEVIAKTGIENPGSDNQIKQWFADYEFMTVKSITKDTVPKMLADPNISDLAKLVLKARGELKKTSVSKYDKMAAIVNDDGRARGTLQFNGAQRTGRWAGRQIQVQNFTKHKMSDEALATAREVVKSGDYEFVQMMYGDVQALLSEIVRTAIIAPPGAHFDIADFSAIEARVIAWLAKCKWRMDVFAGDGKIYEASASMMFNVPLESITKDSEYRAKGKVAELAFGYGGGENAIGQFDKKDEIPKRERKSLVKKWRKANPEIVRFWESCENAARLAIATKGVHALPAYRNILYSYDEESGNLTCRLPSGRELVYQQAWLEQTSKGQTIKYMGIKDGKWCKLSTYGGKLVENITQAVARDCLAVSLVKLQARGFKQVLHVHDEVVAEVYGESRLQEMLDVMSEPIDWAPGLILRGAGFSSPWYMKD